MKKIHNLKAFVVCLGLLIFTEITIGTYFRGALTTIERRFQLSSTAIALITSCAEFGSLAVLPFVSFFGSRYHRPRAIAFGTIFLLLGLISMVLPHFVYPPYEFIDLSSKSNTLVEKMICSYHNLTDSSTNESCKSLSSPYENSHIWLVVGKLLAGLGGAAVSPLGVSYIDDHCTEHNSASYIGLMQSIGFIGPLFGYVSSGIVLKKWVNFPTVNASTLRISPKNSNWVGAWWLGFLVGIAVISVISIPFWFFPKTIKNSKRKEKRRENYEEKNERNPGDLLKATKRLLQNKLFLLIILLWTVKAIEISGGITFKTKFVEVNYGKSASQSSYLIGMVSGPFLILGTLLGSSTIRCFKLEFNGIIRIITFSRLVSTIAYFIMMKSGCTPRDIAGINVPYFNQNESFSEILSVNQTCNSYCQCSQNSYVPVCDNINSVTYLSPCLAGCVDSEIDSEGRLQNYTSCGCVEEQVVTIGACEASQTCMDRLWKLLVLLGLVNFMSGYSATSGYMLLLRCVETKDKAYAMGIAILLVKLIGWIPAPIIFGAFIDKACAFWTTKKCSNRHYCSIYDNDMFRQNFFMLLISTTITTVVLSLFTEWVGSKQLSKKLKTENAEEDQEEILNKNDSSKDVELFETTI